MAENEREISLPADVLQRCLAELRRLPAEALWEDAKELAEWLLKAARASVPQEKADEASLDLRFSDTEEIYVDNFGLAILWPFLEPFFERLNLFRDQRFRDESALRQGVGLLQYIATEAPSLPEYLLPLNKVLCGMEVTEVFDFGPPVSDEEAEECTNLLNVETFAGIAILASNQRENLDEAFARRFEPIIYFPIPRSEERLLLWRQAARS